MKNKLIVILFLSPLIAGCVQPGYGPNAGYFALDPAVAESNRRYTTRIEQEGRDMDHQERMRRAQATELSTRHNPKSVTNNTTSFWFW